MIELKINLIKKTILTCRDPTVGFQSSGSGYREIWTRRIRIWGQKLPNLSVRAEKWENQNFLKFIFGFLVIAPTGSLGFGPDLVGIFPRSLPQLSKQLRDQNKRQKPEKNESQNFDKNQKKYYVVVCFAIFCYVLLCFLGTIIDRLRVSSITRPLPAADWRECTTVTVRL